MADEVDNTAWKKAWGCSPALTMLLPALLVGFMGIGWGLPDETHRLYFTTRESLDSAVRTVGEHRRETEAAAREGRPAPEKLPRSAYNALRTYHPDEYYVFKMLSGIRPGRFRFDPKWYVIGGAYLYPLGAWLKGAEAVGLATLVPGYEFYLERPAECLVARARHLPPHHRQIGPPVGAAGGKGSMGVLDVVARQADLLQLVDALDSPGRLARGLDRRQQQGSQDANDGNHHEQLHQRKGAEASMA